MHKGSANSLTFLPSYATFGLAAPPLSLSLSLSLYIYIYTIFSRDYPIAV